MTGHINVMLFLQSCTDSIQVMADSSTKTFSTSSDVTYGIGNVTFAKHTDTKEEEKVNVNVKTEKDIVSEEKACVDIKDEDFIYSKEEK
jgi:hypothetical protein